MTTRTEPAAQALPVASRAAIASHSGVAVAFGGPGLRANPRMRLVSELRELLPAVAPDGDD